MGSFYDTTEAVTKTMEYSTMCNNLEILKGKLFRTKRRIDKAAKSEDPEDKKELPKLWRNQSDLELLIRSYRKQIKYLK